jgi:hypothetical protein
MKTILRETDGVSSARAPLYLVSCGGRSVTSELTQTGFDRRRPLGALESAQIGPAKDPTRLEIRREPVCKRDQPALGPQLCFRYNYKVIMTIGGKKFP